MSSKHLIGYTFPNYGDMIMFHLPFVTDVDLEITRFPCKLNRTRKAETDKLPIYLIISVDIISPTIKREFI